MNLSPTFFFLVFYWTSDKFWNQKRKKQPRDKLCKLVEKQIITSRQKDTLKSPFVIGRVLQRGLYEIYTLGIICIWCSSSLFSPFLFHLQQSTQMQTRSAALADYSAFQVRRDVSNKLNEMSRRIYCVHSLSISLSWLARCDIPTSMEWFLPVQSHSLLFCFPLFILFMIMIIIMIGLYCLWMEIVVSCLITSSQSAVCTRPVSVYFFIFISFNILVLLLKRRKYKNGSNESTVFLVGRIYRRRGCNDLKRAWRGFVSLPFCAFYLPESLPHFHYF